MADQCLVLLQDKLHCELRLLEMVVLLFVLLSLGFSISFGFQYYLSFRKSGVSLSLRMSVSAFCSLWRDEIRHQLLAKGTILIKVAQSLDQPTNFDFLSALVMLHKRL